MELNDLIQSVSDPFYHRERLLKWLPVALGCTIASMVCGLITALTDASTLMTLISGAVSLVSLFVLFKLSPVHDRFRKAAIFSAISIGGSILVLLFNMSLVSLAASICSILASYQELNGFSEITAPLNGKLSRSWHSLFTYELIIGIVSGFLSSAGVVIAVLADLDPETIVRITLLFVAVVSAVLSLVRILYLKKTITLYQEG